MNAPVTQLTANPIDSEEQRQWLLAHKADTGLSWPQLGAKIGRKHQTLSLFAGGNYAANGQPIADQVHRYRLTLDAQAERQIEVREKPAYFETPTSRQIIMTLRIAQFGQPVARPIGRTMEPYGGMAIIAGAPGTSKTSACEHYRDMASNVWIATMKPSTGGISPMQYKVMEALGAEEEKRRGTPIAMSNRIEALLRNTGGLLIIDEAHYLSVKSLEEIRSWQDETGIGIVLVGNDDLVTRMTLGSLKDTFARLFSRIDLPMIFRGPAEGDALALADAWEIDADDQRAFIVDTCRQEGGMRRCTKMLQQAVLMAAMEQQPLALTHMRTARAQGSPRGLTF